MNIDHAKVRRESMRWYLLLTLYNAQPVGAYEELLLSTLIGIFPDTSQHEIRTQLDYLRERVLVDINKEPAGRWFCKLDRYGIDIVEYTIDCQPGIARPQRQ